MDEDDRTRVRHSVSLPGGVVAPAAATNRPADEDTHALPNGTRLDEFELVRRIGEGGFSIVYLAWDHSLDRKVAVKEYMPGSLATRVGLTEIRPRSDRHRETFQAGLKSFINEAKLLAQFDHPALVKVYRFWEANGTAYLVMPLYDGTTLKDAVRAMPHPPGEDWLIGLLTPLTAALNVIHAEHCYHRDIAPDNVMLLTDSGKPLLLDFGAARRVIGDMTQALTVILKPGYAPVEQYAEVPGMKQGPWTDVYALAATVYWAVTGKIPPPSVGRMVSDAYVPLSQAATGRYSAGFLQAIDRALVVLPEARTQTVAALRLELGIDGATRTMKLPAPLDDDKTVIVPQREARGDDRRQVQAKADASGSRNDARSGTPARDAGSSRDAASTADGAQPSRRGLALGAGAAGVVAVAAALWWGLRPAPTAPPAPAPDTAAAAASAPSLAAASAPSVATPEAASSSVALQPPPTPPADGPSPPPAEPALTTAEPSTTTTATTAATPPRREHPPRAARTDAPPAETRPAHDAAGSKAEVAARNAECAQIYQRLSLGETRPDLLERAKALNCR
jgi:serine/threonine protein kinase